MELPNKLKEQTLFKTAILKIEEHLLPVVYISTLEENSTQPTKKTKIEQCSFAVTFLTVYNGIFVAATKFNKLYFTPPTSDDDFNVNFKIPPGAYELESLNREV